MQLADIFTQLDPICGFFVSPGLTYSSFFFQITCTSLRIHLPYQHVFTIHMQELSPV